MKTNPATVWFLTVVLTLSPCLTSKASEAPIDSTSLEQHFDMVTLGEVVFTNVWVHRQTNFNILIRHNGGIHTIKLTDLPQEQLDELKPQLGKLATIEEKQEFFGLKEKVEVLETNQAFLMLRDQLDARLDTFGPMFFGIALGSLFVAWFFYSWCLHVILKKVTGQSNPLIWIPFFQMFPAHKAAGLSGWLVLLWFIPIINWIFPIYWAARLSRACSKSGWTALMFIIPGPSLFFLPYLAFSTPAMSET